MIYHKIGYGGANKIMVFLSNLLIKNGYDVSIYTYASNDEPSYEVNSKIKLIKEKRISKKNFLRPVFDLFKVTKMIRREKPDIIISFLTINHVLSVIGTRFSKIPVIISERGDPNSESGVFPRVKQFFFYFAEGAVFQTKDARDYFGKKLQNKSVVIPNPAFKPNIILPDRKARKKEISFVGRFVMVQKRQDLMLKAFSQIAANYPDYKLVFYGDGIDMEKVKNLAVYYKLNDRVIFKGKTTNVLEHISKSELFIMTSDYEGIPNALIEAMSLGLPCISTDCDPGGARLLIENGFNGILVPKDDAYKLAESISYLIDNPLEADKLGDKAKEIVDDFSVEKNEKAWLKYIKDILNSKSE